MFKIITTIVLSVLAVLFTIQNFDHVPVYFFWGKAVNIRLIFVIAISAMLGYFVRLFIGIAKEERLKRKINFLRRQIKNSKKRTNEIDNEFDEEDISISA